MTCLKQAFLVVFIALQLTGAIMGHVHYYEDFVFKRNNHGDTKWRYVVWTYEPAYRITKWVYRNDKRHNI